MKATTAARLAAILVLVCSHAGAATYYVRSDGNDAWDGLSPTFVSDSNGPKATLGSAVATVNAAAAGYHLIDVGAGLFNTDVGTGVPVLTRTMQIVGQGEGLTFVNSPSNLNFGCFMIGGVADASAVTPLLFKDFSFTNSGSASGIMLYAGGGQPSHVQLEQVSADHFAGLGYGIRLNNNQDTGNNDWRFKDFTARHIPYGETLFMRSNGRTPAPRSQRWVWENAEVSDNGNIWHSLAGNRWVMEASVLTNSIWSRNGSNGAYGLNGSTHTDFLGRNVIYDSTIEDNNNWGVWAPRMGAGASLIIINATIRDTGVGLVQATNVYLTIPTNNVIGQIRAVNTVFDSVVGGSVGLYLSDDGAVQTSPIELKSVAFNNCEVGLRIGGTTANLWYIDPSQSGATIGAGTLVSGGRMTSYGDADLDGDVDADDVTAVGGQPYAENPSATWATGDFDFDGDFDADDWAWLPSGDTTTDTSTTSTTSSISTTTSTTTTTSSSTTAPLVVADDVADNYGDFWAGNGGTGFESWVFVTDIPAGAAGGFLANTTAQTDLNYIWSTPDFKGWGTYANGAGYQAVVAFRAFAGNALSASGDVFRVSMENGAVQAGTTCGVVLRNGNDNLIVDDFDNGQRLQFFFRGGDANYKVIDDAGERDSGVAWTVDGLNLVVSLTGADTYRLDVYNANGGGLLNSLSGTLLGSGAIDSLALFNRDAEDANVYFNKLSLATASASTTTTSTSTTTSTDSTSTDSTTTESTTTDSTTTTTSTTTDTTSTTDTSTTSTSSTLPITEFSSVQTGAYQENSTWDVDANPGGGTSDDTVRVNDTHTVTVTVANDADGDVVTIHAGGTLAATRATVANFAYAGAQLVLDGGTLAYDGMNVSSEVGGRVLVQTSSTLRMSSGAPANQNVSARFESLEFAAGPGDGFVLNVLQDDALMPGAVWFTNGTITVSGVISNDSHEVGLLGVTLAGSATLTKRGSGTLGFDKFTVVEGPINFQAGRVNFLSAQGIRSGSLTVPEGGTLWGQRLDTKYSWNLGANHPTITLSNGSSLLFDIGNQFSTVGGNVVINGNVVIDSYSAFSDIPRYVVYRGLSFSGAGHVVEFRQTGGSTQPQFTVFDTDVAINEDATMDVAHATAVADLRAVTFTAGKTLTKRGVGTVAFGNSVTGDGNLTIEAGNVSSAAALDLGSLTFTIDGPTLGSDYGQLLIGNQNLTNTRLDVPSSGVATNDTFVLVIRSGGVVALNDLNDAAIGEGGVFVSSDNGEWVLSYAGGDGNDVAVVYAGTATTTTTTDTTDTSSTSTIATTTTSSSTTTAGVTYFVRTAEEGGNDSWDGLSPTHLGGFNGPKLHVDNAVSTANPVDGYHLIDIGVGVFKTIQVSPVRPMRIVGKGIGQTLLDGPNSASLYHFSIAGVVGASATRPLLFRDFTFVNTNAANGNLVLAGGGTPDHVRFEQVSADDFEGLLYGIRMNNNNPGGLGNADWVFKNFSATNIAAGGGEWLFLRSNASTPSPRTQRWVFDQATIADNGTIYGSMTDGRWVVEGFRLTNSTWSRNGNNGSFGLNGSTTTDFLGRNRIDDSTIEDNNLYGVWAPRMGAGADLIIENAIIRDTPAGHPQCTHVHVTIEAATTIGQIRAVNTVFDSLGGCGGSRGLYVEDNGAVQTSPIELRNVAFNNCDTGLFIGGTSANLWYIDPAQSGATINGGTLVSGGRMTVYGDANLDGQVNGADIAAVGGFPYTVRENATWADGDFDFDGDFDAQDWKWLPVPSSMWLIIR